jgi:ATP-binding cassette subfamily F protein 3
MGSVQLLDVTKQYGAKVVLDGVSLQVHTGETVGLVGVNGAGKTTLFRLIAGLEPPDMGEAVRSRGLTIGVLPQEPQFESEGTLHDEVARAFQPLLDMEHRLEKLSERIAQEHDSEGLDDLMAEYDRVNAQFETAGGHRFRARLKEILTGLGFDPAMHNQPVSTLSGGQKCRAALARLLLQGSQLLLLDEPTNHLDMDSTRWLEKFLAGHEGGAVVISHDRYLLDRLAQKIIEVRHSGVSTFPGNYSNFVQTVEQRRLTQERQFEKDREFIAKERAFIAKHIAGQRTNEAKGRRKRLERRIKEGEFTLDKPDNQRQATFRTQKVAVEAKRVLACQGLAKSFGSLELFSGLDLEVTAGQRLGILGPNGSGKTTLLRILLGQESPDAGEIRLIEQHTFGYYAQEHDELDFGGSVIDELLAACPGMTEQQARNELARFLFMGDDVFKPVHSLSGGEQSRVRLARLILTAPSVLILDEPTNHLDIPSREVLEDALQGYAGTVLFVSHDRYFIDKIATRLIVLGKGTHTLFDGNYSYYLEKTELAATTAQAKKTSKAARQSRTVSAENAAAPAKRKRSPYDNLTLEQIEERILSLEIRVNELHEKFADTTIYRDPDKARRLQEDLSDTESELNELNQVWEERVDQFKA